MTSTKRATDYGGLHREKQMWDIIHYLTYNQEKQQFPDREAKQIREHLYMTQLDFFDMQEDQKRALAPYGLQSLSPQDMANIIFPPKAIPPQREAAKEKVMAAAAAAGGALLGLFIAHRL